MGRRSLLAVAGLVLLAGCGTAVPFGSGGESTATLTPVPVAEDGSGDERVPPPPGVSRDGSGDPVALLEAHFEHLAGESYTYRFTYESEIPDPNVSASSFDRRLLVAGESFLVEQINYGFQSNVSLYAAGADAVQRVDSGDRVEYERRRDVGGPRSFTFTDEVVSEFLGWPASNVSVVERDGRVYYRLHFTQAPEQRLVRSHRASVDNYSATAYVTPAGFVETVAVEYEVVGDERRQLISFRSSYVAVGETTLDRPEWVDEVPRGTPASTGTPPTSGTPGTPATSPSSATPENASGTPENATATSGNGTATPSDGTATPDEGTDTPGTAPTATPTEPNGTDGAAE